MNRILLTLCLPALTLLAAPPAPAGEDAPQSERVHAFYYTWYRNPDTDGHWSHWNHNVLLKDGSGTAFTPPEDIGANFYPAAGLYSSMNPNDTRRHMEEMKRAGVGVAAVTWWGTDHPTNKALPVVFEAARKTGMKVCFHLEPFPGRGAATTRQALAYLHEHYGAHPALFRHKGRPLVYVYDSYLTPPGEWASIFTKTGADTIRDTPLDCVAVGLWVKEKDGEALRRGGFDGAYTYFATDGFTHGSTVENWPGMARWLAEKGMIFIPSAGPGYDDTRIRPWNGENRRDREKGAYYDRMFAAALAVNPEIVSVTSYNEWHEGTQIEPAAPRQSPGFTYADHQGLPPEWYLDRTRHWAGQLKAR